MLRTPPPPALPRPRAARGAGVAAVLAVGGREIGPNDCCRAGFCAGRTARGRRGNPTAAAAVPPALDVPRRAARLRGVADLPSRSSSGSCRGVRSGPQPSAPATLRLAAAATATRPAACTPSSSVPAAGVAAPLVARCRGRYEPAAAQPSPPASMVAAAVGRAALATGSASVLLARATAAARGAAPVVWPSLGPIRAPLPLGTSLVMPAKEPVAPLAIRLRPCSAAAVLRCPIRVPQACPSCRAEPEGQSPVRSAREGLGRPARAVLLARPRSLGSGAAAASGRSAAAGAAPALRAASARTALPRALWLEVWVGASGLAVLPSPLAAPCSGKPGGRRRRPSLARAARRPLVRRSGVARAAASFSPPLPWPCP